MYSYYRLVITKPIYIKSIEHKRVMTLNFLSFKREEIGDFMSQYEPSELLDGTIYTNPDNEVTEVRLGGFTRKVLIRPDNASEDTSFYIWNTKMPKIFFNHTNQQTYIDAANDVVTSLQEVIDMDGKNVIHIRPNVTSEYEKYERYHLTIMDPTNKNRQTLVLTGNQGMMSSATKIWSDVPTTSKTPIYEKIPEPNLDLFEGLAYLLIPKPQL